MTMLDRMRRHKNWLKWSLAIVVVAFVLLYIPNFLRNGIGGSVATGTRDVIASVEGQTITVGQFRRIYQQQMQAYRRRLRRQHRRSSAQADGNRSSHPAAADR